MLSNTFDSTTIIQSYSKNIDGFSLLRFFKMSLRQLLSRHTRVPTILSSRTYVGLPDEVQMLKDMTRTFAEQELAPIAGKIDKEWVRRFSKPVAINLDTFFAGKIF